MDAKIIYDDPIKRGALHHSICKWIERNKGEKKAIKFHKDYVKIERNQGVIAAMAFQMERSKDLGYDHEPVVAISIQTKGDKVIITVMENTKETKEQYKRRKAEMRKLGIKID